MKNFNEPHQPDRVVKIGGNLIPVWFIESRTGFDRFSCGSKIASKLEQRLFLLLQSDCCRGTDFSRLPTILRSGCDVEPSDSPMFVGPIDKALEYGSDTDQLIMLFHQEALERSWREVPATIKEEVRQEIQVNYPNLIPTDDETVLWFTRLSPNDRRAATYERSWGYWIPGNSWQALAALVLISEDISKIEVMFDAATLSV